MVDSGGIVRRLISSGHRVTSPRLAIVESVAPRRDHFSAQEVWSELRQADATIGRATVFRTLDLLADLGVVDRLHSEDGTHRFHVTDAASGHHHHLRCVDCGRVETLESEVVERLVHSIAERSGYELHDHHVELTGRCADCRR
jgi:Fur family ferric uptake transcriptional regulator